MLLIGFKENEVCAAQTGISHHGCGMDLKVKCKVVFPVARANGFRQDPLKFL